MASTNWDTDRKSSRPPAWDPPKLLLVIVSSLHVVVRTSRVEGVVVDDGVWLLGSTIWLHHPRRSNRRVKRGSKATVSTHPKYSQARIYTTYAALSKEGYICGLGCRNARIERRPSPIED